MNFIRIAVIGGITSYRALFDWLSPWILVPSLVVTPLAQILLFAYIGRAGGVESDEFFVIGNAMQYSAVPCLFGMTSVFAGERLQRTFGLVLISPASRLALVIGRSVPVLMNGLAVSLFALVVGSFVLGAGLRTTTMGPLALALLASDFACIGLGLIAGALGQVIRDTATLSSIVFGALLVFCGADVPLSSLPGWMARVGTWLPMTHGIAAARALSAGRGLGGVSQLLAMELLLGVGYGVIGAVALRALEVRARRTATLERV